MSTIPILPGAPYVYGLDIARFLCALMVAVFHLTAKNPDAPSYIPLGWVGVEIFFVISGVVIANSAANATPWQFVRGRFLRLYPAAWIAAAINVACLVALPLAGYENLGLSVRFSAEAVASSIALIGDEFMASAYWTLPIELAFYTAVFVCLLNGGATRFRLIARVLVLVSAAYMGLLAAHYAGVAEMPWLVLGNGIENMLLLRHGVYFAIGMYFWMLTNRRSLDAIDHLILSTGCAVAAFEVYVGGLYSRLDGGWHPHALAGAGVAVVALAACFIFLSLRHAGTWVPSPRAGKLLRTLGLMTYPYYLIHELLGGLLLHVTLEAGFGWPAALAISLASVGMAAYLIARHAEPFLRKALGSVSTVPGRLTTCIPGSASPNSAGSVAAKTD